MKRTFLALAALAALFTASPASADDAYWPRTDNPNPFHFSSVYEQDVSVTQRSSVLYEARAKKHPAKPATINPYNHDFAPFGQAGSMPVGGLNSPWFPSLTQAEQKAQNAINRAYERDLDRRLRNQAYREGHWAAGELPVGYANRWFKTSPGETVYSGHPVGVGSGN